MPEREREQSVIDEIYEDKYFLPHLHSFRLLFSLKPCPTAGRPEAIFRDKSNIAHSAILALYTGQTYFNFKSGYFCLQS